MQRKVESLTSAGHNRFEGMGTTMELRRCTVPVVVETLWRLENFFYKMTAENSKQVDTMWEEPCSLNVVLCVMSTASRKSLGNSFRRLPPRGIPSKICLDQGHIRSPSCTTHSETYGELQEAEQICCVRRSICRAAPRRHCEGEIDGHGFGHITTACRDKRRAPCNK